MIYEYKAKLNRVVDGDTVHFDVDLGFGVQVTLDFRLAGINTPEVVGSQRVAGLAAKAEVTRLLGLGTIRIISMKTEKYGRWLATIFVKQADGKEIEVNQALIDGGFAVPYNGDGPKPV
jgi:micrococcal nuclease